MYLSFLERRPDRNRSAAFLPLCSLPPGSWPCGAAAAPSWLRAAGGAASATAAAAAASSILSLPDDSSEAADSASERALLLVRSASTRAGAGLAAAAAGDACGSGGAAGVGAVGSRPLRVLRGGVGWAASGCVPPGRAGEAGKLRKLPCCSTPPLTDEPSPPPRRLPPVLSCEDLRGMGGLAAAPLACACPPCCLPTEGHGQQGTVLHKPHRAQSFLATLAKQHLQVPRPCPTWWQKSEPCLPTCERPAPPAAP